MKVFVAGGTGFVGSYLLPQLISNGHQLTLLTRNEKTKIPQNCQRIAGDALLPDSFKLDGFDAVINLIAIIREFPSRGITYSRYNFEATANIAREAKRAGVKRFIQMSANGVDPNGVSDYQRAKFEAEQCVKNSGFEFTIFRPSLIFGKPPKGKDEFCSQISRILKISPIIPLFGHGLYKFQPIAVTDVAKILNASLDNQNSIGKTFHLGGRETFSYRELLDIICSGSGISKRLKVALPYQLARPFISILGRLPFFPATVDQTDMLVQGNVVPEISYIDSFGIEPEKFSAKTLSYLNG